jgi:hypothetical protein
VGRKVDVDNLVSVSEIATELGVSRQLVHAWRERHPDFPAPIARLGGEDRPGSKRKAGVLVWNWPDVLAWAKATGRWPVKGEA